MKHICIQIFLCVLFLLVNSNANAQTSIGIYGGYTLNSIQGYAVNTAIAKLKAAAGYTTGLTINTQAGKHISIQAAPGIITKNYAIVRRDVLFKNIYDNTYNTYLQVPVTANYKHSFGRLSGYIGAGFFTAYWLHKQQKGRLPDIFSASDVSINNQLTENLSLVAFNKAYKFDSKKDNRFELGYTATVSVDYLLNNILSVYINIRYFNALTDQQKKYMLSQIARQNRTLCFCIGTSINLHK